MVMGLFERLHPDAVAGDAGQPGGARRPGGAQHSGAARGPGDRTTTGVVGPPEW